MVDDQSETYTVDLLRRLKGTHESWVSSALAGQIVPPPVRIRRVKEDVPSRLLRVTSWQMLLSILDGALAFQFGHDELRSEDEVELVGSFLQEAQDWGDLSGDFDAGEKVRATFRIGEMLRELEEGGFWVFGATEARRLEGGVGAPSSFPVAILQVLRPDNPEIVKWDLTAKTAQDRGQDAAQPESGGCGSNV